MYFSSVSASGVTQEGTGMYIRQIDRNAIQIQASKDGQKQELMTNKVQSTAQNVQMITVPHGMTVLQNPLNISQMPVLGQPNSQVYMIPANHPNIVQAGGLPLGQQVLQPGQNVTVMQPNQLGVPGGVQYNVPIMPMNVPPNSHYMPGINLNTQLSTQQINAALAGQQLNNPNLGTIPIVQAPMNNPPPSSPMTNPPQIPITQPPPVQQIVPQNSFINPSPTSQYAGMPPQYMQMQPNSGAISVQGSNQNIQYSLPSNQTANSANNGSGQSSTTSDSDTNGASNQANYISSSSQDNGYISNANAQNSTQQNFANDGSNPQNTGFVANPPVTQANYGGNGNNQTQGYVNQATTNQPPSADYNPGNGSSQTPNQNYPNAQSAPNAQNQSQPNFPGSTMQTPNQPYPNMQSMGYPPNQNPYPNATGQNLAAYANNQYQYQTRPWVRPRYGSPQGSPYPSSGVPPNGPPMPVPPPSGNYNYWQDS